MYAKDMIRTAPRPAVVDVERLSQCIEACYDCAQTCSACADACLGEDTVRELTACISLNEVCADACVTTGAALSRTVHHGSLPIGALLESCAETCRMCAEECERHAAHMEHCRICADACQRCEQACRELLATIAA